MLPNAIFFLGIALIFTHELDAINKHEWRLFIFLRPLGDKNGFRFFDLGYASALGYILMAIMFVAAFFYVRSLLGSEQS